MKNKGFTLVELLGVLVVLAIMLIVTVPAITSSLKSADQKEYDSFVNNIIDSAELYVETNREKFPELSSIGGVSAVPIRDLIDSGFLKENTINPDTDEVVDRTELVGLYVNDDKTIYYEYPTQLQTVGSIAQTLLDSHETYTYMGGTYLKGAQDNNYIWLSGNLYRIMGRDENENVRLISEGNITVIPYDDTSNVFETSHVYEWLNSYFYSHLDSNLQSKLEMTSYCKDVTDDSSSAKTTCSSSGSTRVSLMSLDEFNLAGSASYFKDSQRDGWWSLTPNTDSSNTRNLSYSGNVYSVAVTNIYGVRPIITVSSNLVILVGNGSQGSPYQTSEKIGNGNLNDVSTSGEYVRLDGNLYRVIEKTTEGTKIVLDGYLYADGITYSDMLTRMQNGTTLNELVTSANQSKVATVTWNHGQSFDYGNHYNISLDNSGTDTFAAKVGTVRIGEMYAAPSDSVLGSNRMTYSWSLTKRDVSYSWRIYANGTAYVDTMANTNGVRPVLVIAPAVTVTNGNGTLSAPYEI